MYECVTSDTLIQLYNLTNDEYEAIRPAFLTVFGTDLKFDGFTFEFTDDDGEIVHVSKSQFLELLATHVPPYQPTAYDVASRILQNNVIMKSVSNQDLIDALYVKDEEADYILQLMGIHSYELLRSENNNYYLHDLVNVENIHYVPKISIMNLVYGWICDITRQQPSNQEYAQKKQQYLDILQRVKENFSNDVTYNIIEMYAY